MGGWRDVYEDIRVLCRTLAELPDDCVCGDKEGHMNGTCPCCGNTADYRVPACGTCGEQLARLRADIDLMTVDVSRFFPFVRDFLGRHDAAAAGSAGQIQAKAADFIASFDRLVLAEGVFRKDCRLSHVHVLKDAAAALLAEAAALDRVLD